ncbi:probable LRR receptor-like serine/threonine-protein kinase At1g67720 [Cryptomeria japonica]|uniref:probable LRR receptor-like serine/threonine-protein kinase At1g67720 n=1 Tax=Cryptomeria japonica TaxID=3369 RepID=UPI0027D9CEEC|nr:probable LRR receptor-like serine/threonine-protein kinase At1g67720 [Cryptomeria japonica]
MLGMGLIRVCLLIITTFIGLLSFAHSNPDGFLNINCGANDNQTDKNHLDWISDSPFIKARNFSSVLNLPETLYLQYLTLAYFPNLAVKKYCYLLPVKPDINYLIRATFAPHSTIPWASFFDLFIEGIMWRNLNLTGLDNDHNFYYEIILAAKSDSLSLCLARNSQTEQNHFVFISSIELRALESSMYDSTDFQKHALSLVGRTNYGTSSLLQYPDDLFDRKWAWSIAVNRAMNLTAEEEETKSLGSELANKPPVNVLRTAIAKGIVDDMRLPYSFVPFSDDPAVYYFALYFCNLNKTDLIQRFVAYINGNQISDYIELNFLQCWQTNKDLELDSSDPINITLKHSLLSQLGPFINGAEMYKKMDVKTTTYSGDVVAIRKIAEAMNVPDDWTGGDPCLPANYSSTGITCSQDDPPRVIIINLTSMHLEGTIPSIIADFTALIQLMLGNNKLSGHIPDLSSLKNLTKLELQNNQFTGGIPRSLEKLQMLKQLFLQDNKFEGTVSKGLVRPNLDLRVDPQNAILEGSHKMKGWVIGLLIGCSVVLVLVIVSGIFLWRHKHPSQPFQTTDVSPTTSEKHIFADEKNQNDYHRLAIEYTEEDIKISTNNYSTPIGRGSFGAVFYGRLSGYEVAVKIHKTDSNQGKKEFQNEVAMLSRIYHKNLVNLIGYCRQPIMALVYEYMPCGTLTDRLYGIAKLETPLDWLTRLNIARQAADGLLYLHQSCYPPIIHRDIKCSNILLDNRMSAKLADFGISKLVESSSGYIPTEVKGTMGYLDPEYFATSSLNEKSDVYSFGVVLLEIISGVPPKDGIVQSAHKLLSCGKIDELMDPSLGGRYNVESAWKVAEIAYMCVEKESTNRPKMSAVVKELEEAVTLASGDNNYSALHTVASFNTGDMPSLR